MIKLTKDQIQYIENYLIKNDVKYWDVRVELLDHIVSAVEETMEHEDKTFLKALSEAHRGFGNQLMPRYDDDYYLEKALYQANNGFKKFIMNRQKEFAKEHRRAYKNHLVKQFSTFNFYIEFLAIGLIVFIAYKISAITAIYVSMGVLLCCEILKYFHLFKHRKFLKQSLKFNLLLSSSSLFWTSQFFLVKGYQSLFESEAGVQYQFLILFYCISYCFFRPSLMSFLGFINDYNKNYKTLMFS